MAEINNLPDDLFVLPLAGSQTEVGMRKTAIAYNNSRDPEFRKVYLEKYKSLAEDNRWD